METILIVDDERNYLIVLEDLLAEEGYHVLTADTPEKGLEAARTHDLDALVTDMRMPGMDGMALLDAVHGGSPDLPVIMMTAFGTVEKAVEAMKKGAFDYILKPFKNEELKLVIRKALDHHRLIRQNRELTRELQDRYQFGNIIGKNAAMRRIYALIEKVAPSRATILVTGESGTGKELIARAIHYNSPRRDLPFISVNCGALPENLLESELFGHERGAFTGAVAQRKGRFELAHGGTLFLDEISEMSPPLQVKLLRVLQEMTFERVGGSQTLHVDVRIVAASNRNLKEDATSGRFRSDLFYRLNVVHIQLPALRERTDDIPLLVNHFLAKHAPEHTAITLDPEAMRKLLDYPWPGNIRELENAVERAVLLAGGDRITARDLPPEIGAAAAPQPAPPPPEPECPPETEGGPPPAPPGGERNFETGVSPRQARGIAFAHQRGSISNRDYASLNEVSERQALRELAELALSGHLVRVGKGRASRYVPPDGGA